MTASQPDCKANLPDRRVAPAGRRAQGPGSGDDVDQPAGHVDHAPRRRVAQVPAHVLVGDRDLARRVLVGVGGDVNARAHLALDLDRDLDLVRDQPPRIGLGPGLESQRLGVPEALPELLGQVRRQRRQQEHQRLVDTSVAHSRARRRTPRQIPKRPCRFQHGLVVVDKQHPRQDRHALKPTFPERRNTKRLHQTEECLAV